MHGIDWRYPSVGRRCFLPPRQGDTANAEERSRRQRVIDRGVAAWYSQLHFEEVPWGIDSVHAQVDRPVRDSVVGLDSLREDRIAENILALAARHPGKRVAVVLGGLHLQTQPRRLRGHAGVRLMDARHFLPLTSSDVEAAWSPEDVYPLLGATIDSWITHGFPHVFNHGRSRRLLDSLTKRAPTSAAARYYQARWELMLGRYERAASLLDSLLAQRPGDLLPVYEPESDWSWPPWSRIADKASFTRAILFDLQDRHPEAILLYEALLRDLAPVALNPPSRFGPGYYDLQRYLRSLIHEPYRGGPWESFRIQDSRRCWDA